MCRCNGCLVKSRGSNRVSMKEQAMIRCNHQVKTIPTPLILKEFHLLIHLLRRRMMTRTWTG